MSIRSLLFKHPEVVEVGDVQLDPRDGDAQLRAKLARIVLDQMFQFVALLGRHGVLLEVNRAALEGGGINLEDVQGKPFWEVHWWTISAETQRRLQEAVGRAAAGEFVRYDVEVFGSASGTGTIVIDFSLLPVRAATGEVAFLLAEGRNITAKKEAEAEIARQSQELRKLVERVRNLDELKTRFFANVSHELRTPLALVMGPLERLLAGRDLTEPQCRDLDVARRNAALLLKHVQDLLDISKMEAGKMVAFYAEMDVARVARIVASYFGALAEQRRISLEVDAPERLLAQLDAEKIERVVTNLVSNAFKFAPDGGRVRVAVSAHGRDALLLTVQDDGPGVPPAMREVIFERFRQADESATRRAAGTGLGLAIAKEFVELQDGTLSVTDAPGGGALFRVQLPTRAPAGVHVAPAAESSGSTPAFAEVAADQLRSPREAWAPEAPSDERPVVLVVEDNYELRRFIAEALSPAFRVELASNGAEGLERAEAARPDLVVTDIMMPEMSGDAMVRAIRAQKHLDAMPILVLSARADDQLRNDLLRGGCQDYVPKPFSTEELLARATNLVMMKRARELLERELAIQSADVELLAREVTLRKQQAERALDESVAARERAEQSSLAKGEFLSLVSHEMNTPLTSLLLTLDAFGRGGPVRPDERTLSRLSTSVRRLRDLVDSLLEYARLDTGRSKMLATPFDLGELAAHVLDEFGAQAARKQLFLRVDDGPAVPSLDSDRRAVHVILSNLVGNAIKFTDRGGVTVGIGHDDRGHVVIVRDTGPGIAPDDQSRVFDAFEQLQPLPFKSVPGVGLGLALVRRMVAELGGSIALESTVGSGTTFTVHLPPFVTPSAGDAAGVEGSEGG